MERIVEEEWLDADRGTQPEIDAALRSITHVNRRFGGVALHARLLHQAFLRIPPPGNRLPSVLEVASGHADVLQDALLRLRTQAEVVLLDRSAKHLPQPGCWPVSVPQPQIMQGDALALPLPDKSVDVVACCLFLHHLEPPEVSRYLEEAQRVARVAVLVNDLERTPLHYQLARLKALTDPSSLSSHDGPVSVRRAYTRRELGRMLARTGRPFLLERGFLYRLGALLWCR